MKSYLLIIRLILIFLLSFSKKLSARPKKIFIAEVDLDKESYDFFNKPIYLELSKTTALFMNDSIE